jgi:hypothetical protein
MERLGSLNRIPGILADRSNPRDLIECVIAFQFPCDVTEEEWLAATKIVAPIPAADLSWMDAPNQSLLRHDCVQFIQNALIKSWPGYIKEQALKDSLLPFVTWLETRKDREVVDFAWEILKAHLRSEYYTTSDPVYWMKRSGRLQGEISFDNLQLAVSLAEEHKAMYWWPDQRWMVTLWPRESAPYLELMNHESYLVRAAAAGCLGQIYMHCSREKPPLADIMEFLKQQEHRNAGVAGPFLMGAGWGLEWKVGAEFDYRSWFLETLRGSERERFVPHEQSLEFYAHEFFWADADAIEEFLDMGRKKLAVMTATESPEKIYELLPLLQKMAASEDQEIAAPIRVYLAEGRTHAGGWLF